MHNVGWRSAADLLKYPGAPVEPLPKIMRKPMVNRPKDLAPSWMDFIYANTKGSDPYEKWKEGRERGRMVDVMDGEEVQSPFGQLPNAPTPFSNAQRDEDVGEELTVPVPEATTPTPEG